MWEWAYSALSWLVDKLPTIDMPDVSEVFSGMSSYTAWLGCFVDMAVARQVALLIAELESGLVLFQGARFIVRRLPFGK